MVLICDNASYHHKREICSLATKTKFDLVKMMQQFAVKYIDLPKIEHRNNEINSNNIETSFATDISEYCHVLFNQQQF